MPRDGERSRERLLDAATAEFAERGIAGARVNRIAEAAAVNKAQMYEWHASKEGLFDAVFARALDRIVDSVPFTAEDLPGYAIGLYDSYLAEPELVRLSSWYRLERVPTGDLLAEHLERWAPKLEAVARAQAAGIVVDGIPPADVYATVIGMAGIWSPVSGTFTASAADDEADHARRRTILRGLVARALVVGGG